MSRREQFLHEMGLSPVWRLRERPGEAPQSAAANDLSQEDRG